MTTTPLAKARPARRGRKRKPGWVPNQHGAWAMVSLPLIVGVIFAIRDGGSWWVAIPLALFWFAGYFCFFATSLWLVSRRHRRYLPPMITYGAIAAAAGVTLLIADPLIATWAPVFAPLLGTGLWCAAKRAQRSVLSGGVMVVAAALMTPVAYQAITGGWFGTATSTVDGAAFWAGATASVWWATAVVAAYFFGTVLYVKTMIRERGVRRFTVASIGYHAAMTVGALLLVNLADVTWWLGVFWLAITARSVALAGRRVSPKYVGFGEVAASIALFVILLTF